MTNAAEDTICAKGGVVSFQRDEGKGEVGVVEGTRTNVSVFINVFLKDLFSRDNCHIPVDIHHLINIL